MRKVSQAVWAVADLNAVREFARAGVEHVHLIGVPPGNPQLLTVRRNAAHVGATAAGNRPAGGQAAGLEVHDANRALAPVGDEQPPCIWSVPKARWLGNSKAV